MKKALLVLCALLILSITTVTGTLWYIRPTEQLDLSYEKISVFDKVADMVLSGELKLELSNADLTSLIRLGLSAKPQLSEQIRILGARVAVMDGKIALYANVLLGGKVKAGATMYGTLEWAEPNLIIDLEDIYIKKVKLPASLLPEQTSFSIDLYDKLPAIIGIKSVQFEQGKMAVRFKIPR